MPFTKGIGLTLSPAIGFKLQQLHVLVVGKKMNQSILLILFYTSESCVVLTLRVHIRRRQTSIASFSTKLLLIQRTN